MTQQAIPMERKFFNDAQFEEGDTLVECLTPKM
ncbi:hypothetical protein KIPB_011827, partial [Kipferlia bialata]|eukprot:g11827.t1